MGGVEKASLMIGDTPMLARIRCVLAPHCAPLAISSHGDVGRFTAYDLIAIPDETMRGPMAGLADALDWFAARHPEITHVLSVPADTPFLPEDLCPRLAAALEADTFCACAASGGRRHPVIGLWPLAARVALQATVARDQLSFHGALAGQRVADVEWAAVPRDPFFNVNTPEDLAEARTIAQRNGREWRG